MPNSDDITRMPVEEREKVLFAARVQGAQELQGLRKLVWICLCALGGVALAHVILEVLYG